MHVYMCVCVYVCVCIICVCVIYVYVIMKSAETIFFFSYLDIFFFSLPCLVALARTLKHSVELC